MVDCNNWLSDSRINYLWQLIWFYIGRFWWVIAIIRIQGRLVTEELWSRETLSFTHHLALIVTKKQAIKPKFLLPLLIEFGLSHHYNQIIFQDWIGPNFMTEFGGNGTNQSTFLQMIWRQQQQARWNDWPQSRMK